MKSLIIGRNVKCDVAIEHETVSSKHARLQITERGQMELVDLNSRNGTFLIRQGKKVRVDSRPVSDADEVVFGGYTMKIRDILEAVRRKEALMRDLTPGGGVPNPASQRRKDWQRGPVTRCANCGAVKNVGGKCPECAQ